MSVQEPVWRRRTRPCPFFSQGRCLFADSCNFLHDVKVKNTAEQPLVSTIHSKQQPFPPKPVFDPPSVIVNSASPRSVNLAGPESRTSSTQDSSRYSGLLSVLSDVIGPPPTIAERADPGSRTIAAIPSSLQSTPHGRTNVPSASDSVVAGFQLAGAVVDIETEQGVSGSAEPSSMLQPDCQDTSVHQVEYFFPEAHNSFAVGSLPATVAEESSDGNVVSYFVEDTKPGSREEGDGDEGLDGCEEENPTVMLPNRQSTFSSFTGASLLASPRNVFADPSAASPVEDGAADLLSPVELSAKLQPFPIPSLGPKVRRGDSIDSGYADGDSWVSPPPFPRSPPRSFRSSAIFPPHSRRASHSSPALRNEGISCGSNSLRSFPHSPIEVIEEAESDGASVGNEDTAYTILDAYDALRSEEQGEHGACDPLRVNVAMVAAEAEEELYEVPAVIRDLRQYCPELLHPTKESDLDSCNQSSFISDDNVSFKTALSTQTSHEDFGDISKMSTTNLSFISGECLPSILPYDRRSPKSSPSMESSYSPSPYKVILSCAAAGTSNVQEFAPEDVATPHKHASGVLHSDQHSPEPSSSAEGSGSPSSVKDVPSHASHGAEVKHSNDLESLPSIFHFTKHHPNSGPSTGGSRSPSSTKGNLGYALPHVGDVQKLGSEHVAAPQKHISSVLHSDKPSPKSSTLTGSSRSPSPVEYVLSSTAPGADGDDYRSPKPNILHGYFADSMSVLDQNSAEDTLMSDEITDAFELRRNSITQRLSFPLPPPFLLAEFVGNAFLDGDEDGPVMFEIALASPEKDVLEASQHVELQRLRSGSDLTEKARLRELPPAGSPGPATNSAPRRNRAASDLTVKGPGDTSYVSELLPEQPDRSDHVQSLYDQYFDDSTSDVCSGFCSPAHEDAVPANAASPTEKPSQDVDLLDLTSHDFQKASPPCSDSKHNHSGTDSSLPEPIFRPLLTGRRSFLRSSLAELIPKTNISNAKESSSPTNRPTRLQAKEIGSTMVPLGFRRHKPQAVVTHSLRSASQSLHTALPASELRQALRIRTDIDSSRGYASASHVSSATRSPLPTKPMSAPPTGGLKELQLSSVINKRSSILSTHSSSIASSILSLDHIFNSSTPQSPSVSSASSFSCNSLLSSSREQIPEQTHHTLKRTSLISQAANDLYFTSQSSSTRRDSGSVSAPIQQPNSWRLSHYRAGSRNYSSIDVTRRFSRRTSTLSLSYVVDEEQDIDEEDSTTTRPVQSRHADEWMHPGSVPAAPVHAIATPKPTLLFAIASDDVNQVHHVLESGEAGPNDSVGPQSALAFTLTNDKLTHKQEIVKALLAYGANPSALRNPTLNPAPLKDGGDELSAPPPETTLEGMDPATRYFVSRADTAHTRQTSQLIYRSFFRPLTRVRYDVIGQDWALERLFRVLGMHSQKLAVAPIVVLLCGPSGHGKSLLARKFGSLLDIPTHTVNMTTLRSAHDIWESYSMSPYEEPSSCTLAEFLIENEGKRCVVVLDEIEKVEDQKVLWSLLMPWELGRCSWEASKRHVDVHNVIWLGTSNIGHELVFEHHGNRAEPDSRMSREDYLELTDMLRPRVSHCLGPSLISRVTTVLPFVPFTLDEKKAIAAEAVYALGGDASKMLSAQDVESVVTKALPNYHPSEGARSLHRAVSSILVDAV